MDKTNVQREDVVVQRFVWNDENYKCAAGDLLCAITLLTDSHKADNYLSNRSVTNYLQAKGLVEQTSDNTFRVIDDKREELCQLGDQVSDAIGAELESLPVNTEITFGPAIRLMPIRVGAPCADVSPATEIPKEMNALKF